MKPPSRLVEIARNHDLSDLHQAITENLHLSSFCLDLAVQYHTTLTEFKSLAARPNAQELVNAVLKAPTFVCDSETIQYGKKSVLLFGNNLIPERTSQDQLLPTMKEQLKNWRLNFSEIFLGFAPEEATETPEPQLPPTPSQPESVNTVPVDEEERDGIEEPVERLEEEPAPVPAARTAPLVELKSPELPRVGSLEEFLELEKLVRFLLSASCNRNAAGTSGAKSKQKKASSATATTQELELGNANVGSEFGED
eukprot:c20734_g1_i1.p1 GENE.c20734_g1_i1~~c20734_g1_i1.p1  ORF type:complete len:254 (+),score=47.82 c20734_g1_i1:341-1102(+)